MFERLAKLIDVKSLVTLGLIGTLIALMFVPTQVDDGLKNLFVAVTSSVVTYYFTKKESADEKQDSDDGVG